MMSCHILSTDKFTRNSYRLIQLRSFSRIECMLPASVFVLRGFARLRCAKMAKQIEVLLGVDTLGDQKNIVLDGVLAVSIFPCI